MIAAKRQHTPGPWVFTEDPFARSPSLTWNINGFHQVAGFQSPQDCKLATVYDVEANARLISSAPELLSALENAAELAEGAVELLRQLDMESGRVAAECVLRDARAAIEKARG